MGKKKGVQYDQAKSPRDDAARFNKVMASSGDDLTLIILRGHLLVEEKLYSYLKTTVSPPDVIDHLNLWFKSALSLARKLDVKQREKKLWKGIEALNDMRNMLSHELEPDGLDGLIAKLKDPIYPTSWLLQFTVKDGELVSAGPEPVAPHLRGVILWLYLRLDHLASKVRN
jgi:hypothetical protein